MSDVHPSTELLLSNLATEPAEDVSRLRVGLINLKASTNEEVVKSGLESSIQLCGEVLQKLKEADMAREQLETKLQELRQQLDLHMKTGESLM